jgi:diguanylate cyclase (GGDEF)-like protein
LAGLFANSMIGKRMTFLVAFSVLSATMLATALMAILQLNTQVRSESEALQATAMVFARSISAAVMNDDMRAMQEVLKPLTLLPNIGTVAVIDPTGKTLTQIGPAQLKPEDMFISEVGIWPMLTNAMVPIAVNISHDQKNYGKLVLLADTGPVRLSFLLTMLFTLGASLAASIFGVLLSRAPQDRIVEPIIRLTEAMKSVTKNRNYKVGLDYRSDDETGLMIESYNSMIADIRSRDMALQKLAFYDPLTGLPNRPNFQQVIDEIIERNTKVAVFHLDIDGFRELNDALGHSIGDALLMEVAARLHEEADGRDTVFRIGGDEFMIVIPNIESEARAQHALAHYFARLYQPLKLLAHEVHISASAGGLILPRDGKTSGEAMRHADLALMEAKKLGPARVQFFRQQMDDRIQESAELIMGLKQALQKSDFQVYYQPQVDLVTGKADGFEALVRWQHPTKGFISPALFIPVAERAGLVPEIGRFVLHESCKQARAWFSEGRGLRQISVNVSAAQMLQTDFIRQVQEALNESSLPPPLLCLELTESVFLGKSVGAIRHLLNDLKGMGVDLALDDFGTGYSSLSYLEGLPFDKLKIDRSFVNGAHSNPRRKMLLGQIVNMAHNLNMKVVAEGAETQEDVDMLQDMGADMIQGYYFARPAVATEALASAFRIERSWAEHLNDRSLASA